MAEREAEQRRVKRAAARAGAPVEGAAKGGVVHLALKGLALLRLRLCRPLFAGRLALLGLRARTRHNLSEALLELWLEGLDGDGHLGGVELGAPLSHDVALAKRQHVLAEQLLKPRARLAVLVGLLARLGRVHHLDCSACERLEKLGEHHLLVGLGLWILLLLILVGAVDAPENIVDLRDRDRYLAVLDKLHPLSLRHSKALCRALCGGAATL